MSIKSIKGQHQKSSTSYDLTILLLHLIYTWRVQTFSVILKQCCDEAHLWSA